MSIAATKFNTALSESDILELIRDAFCYTKPEMTHLRSTVTLESSIEGLGIQSVAALEMAGFIEERIDVQFADEELSSINGMADLASLVRRHTSPR